MPDEQLLLTPLEGGVRSAPGVAGALWLFVGLAVGVGNWELPVAPPHLLSLPLLPLPRLIKQFTAWWNMPEHSIHLDYGLLKKPEWFPSPKVHISPSSIPGPPEFTSFHGYHMMA